MTTFCRRLGARLFITCCLQLVVSPAFANCLEGLTVGTPDAARDLLGALVKDAAFKCKSDGSEYLYRSLSGFFQGSGDETAPGTEYDVIIVGGGVSGAAAALAIGSQYRVLVIDKYGERTSVFGNTAGYPVALPRAFERSPVGADDLVDVEFFNSPLRVGRNVLINLFYSGADVLLGASVSDIRAIAAHPGAAAAVTPRYLVASIRGDYLARYVIVATGYQGVKLSKFEPATQEFLASALKVENSHVRTAETFFERCAQGPCAEMFEGKAVGIIGGGKSGTDIIAILDRENVNPPKSIDMFGTEGEPFGSRPFGISTRPFVPNIFFPAGYVGFRPVAESIEAIDGGKLEIRSGADRIVVDELILATGYSHHFRQLFSERATFTKTLRNTAALQSIFAGNNLDPDDSANLYQLPSNESPDVDLLAIGAAAVGKTAIAFAFAANRHGIAAGEKIAEDLAISGDAGSEALKRRKIEQRIRFLLSLRN